MAEAVTCVQSAHDSAREPTAKTGKERDGFSTSYPVDTGFAPAHPTHACIAGLNDNPNSSARLKYSMGKKCCGLETGWRGLEPRIFRTFARLLCRC